MKGAVLGLLVLVAAYFWAPLFAKMLPGEKPPQAAAAAEYLDGSVAIDTAGTASEAPPAPRRDWRKLLAQIDSDPLTKPIVTLAPVTLSLGWEEPIVEAAEADQDIELAAMEAAAKITPASVGLKLSGTMVGGGRKVAVISGKSYREGGEVRLTDELVFVVMEVTARRAVLQRGEESFVLELPDRAGVR